MDCRETEEFFVLFEFENDIPVKTAGGNQATSAGDKKRYPNKQMQMQMQMQTQRGTEAQKQVRTSIDGQRHHVTARRTAQWAVRQHEVLLAVRRQHQLAARLLAPQRLRNQRAPLVGCLGRRVVEARRVELHELHVGHGGGAWHQRGEGRGQRTKQLSMLRNAKCDHDVGITETDQNRLETPKLGPRILKRHFSGALSDGQTNFSMDNTAKKKYRKQR